MAGYDDPTARYDVVQFDAISYPSGGSSMTVSLQDVPAGDRTYSGGVLPNRNRLPFQAGYDGTEAQGSDTVADNANVASIVINPTTLTAVHGGAAFPLQIQGTYPNSSTADVSDLCAYFSGTPAVATIDQDGLITPLTAGTSVITVEINGKVATKTLTVS